RHRLREAEEQREITVNALFLEPLGGANALPRAADLDQHALAIDARALVKLDELPRLVDRPLDVEAVARVDLRRDAAGDELQDLGAEVHRELVHEALGACFGVRRSLAGERDRVLDERPILR